ncbi:uncharacterized protein KD926_006254 [Aspergillus affinis]|uniref:uncharacterized protein n=1 Tax=Aspergillus affinis TaxID=1070780 RepID=UPI0022FE128A|nr:uncharacterized protein KD926_006254 [Aspergillus affinis]KAI9041917.1 hypothetical protein KD926_006254 [Aspergillus affinis]
MILSSSLLAPSVSLPQALFTPWDFLAFPKKICATREARKSYLYYAERRKLHLESGPTLPEYASNINISAASVRGKWSRHPLPKPTAASDDLLHFLVTHMAHCDSVFADEKQRLYVLADLNLLSIFACRAVSLFDTRHTVNLQADGRPLETSGSENPINHMEFESSVNKSEDEAPSGVSSHETGKNTEMSELEETELDDICSYHSDLDTASDIDCDSDVHSVTDDRYFEGDEETNTILWRHVGFYIVRNPTPGERYILAAIITLLYTKGEDRKPRMKRAIEHEENLIFDLLSQLMALAIDDDIFAATIKDVTDIYTVPIPAHRRGIQMKIKKEKLDIPIFREPEHTDDGYRTSDSQPLKSRTWSRILKRLRIRAGQAHNLTQKVLRRGGINAINSQAPSSDYDAVMNHPQAIRYVADFMQRTGLLQQFRFATFNEEDEEVPEPSTLLEGLDLNEEDDGYTER